MTHDILNENNMKKVTYIALIFILSITIGCQRYTSNTVVTALPALESILLDLTNSTDIKVLNPVSKDISLAELDQFWDENSTLLDSLAEIAAAVVSIRSVIENETLYLKLRKRNIRIVEIDCATPFDEHVSSVALFKDPNHINPFLWLSISNVMKMAEITAKDLVKLFPADSTVVINNLQKLKKRFFALKTDYESKFSLLEQFEAVTMEDSFDYLLKDINLFVTHRFPSDENEWIKEEKSIFEEGLKKGEIHTIIHRWKPSGEIEKLCAKFEVETAMLVSGDPGLTSFDDGLYGLLEKNLSILLKALTKQ